jgi:hypothetical protein
MGERGRRMMILQQHANKDKMEGISNILVKAKVCCGQLGMVMVFLVY